MTKYVFLLSGDHPELAEEEVNSLFEGVKKVSDRLLAADSSTIQENDFKRLAYTRSVLELLFVVKAKELEKKIKAFDWSKAYRNNFCVRTTNLSGKPVLKEIEIADLVWAKLNNPKTNLDNPETLIEFIFAGDDVYCGRTIFTNQESFEDRKPHKRPEHSPISLHPKLARAMVNLTGIKKKSSASASSGSLKSSIMVGVGSSKKQKQEHGASTPPNENTGAINEILLDPFCGTGGLLIEAGLMRIKTVGYDIHEINLRKAKINLEHFKIKNFSLRKQDATKPWRDKAYYIASDLPYGRSSMLSKEIKQLYIDFLKNLKAMKVKKAVITFPSNIDFKPLIKQANLKIKFECNYYIHASLTKKIVVLEP